MRRRSPRPRGRLALAMGGSVAAHAAVGLLLWGVSAAATPKPPAMRVYKVDIVSPPPNVAGPAMSEPPMESPAGLAASAGTPAEATVAAPPASPPSAPPETPPAPAPKPATTPDAPVREPQPAPAPTRKPTPVTPSRPAPATPAHPTPPKPAAPQPATATGRTADRPATTARPTPPKPGATTAANGGRAAAGAQANAPPSSTRPGLGTTGPGRRPVPATGPGAVASSAGGEGLNVRTAGADFVDRAYLENIIRQVRRYFRPPPGAVSDRASVRFWIERDGSVSDMSLVGGNGSFAFRTAALEAVERAGRDGVFGKLPSAFTDDRLAVTFDFTPPR